ncbi:MAG TPA: glycoside hydrolase family 44 protein [Abditibacteriaceae bacterium]|jgi:hypothetical protein
MKTRQNLLRAGVLAGVLSMVHAASAQVQINIDVNANRRAINPSIYGVAFADSAALSDLNAPLNRSGGNSTTRYNWQQNASNRGSDWYFESIADGDATLGGSADAFIASSKAAGAQPMLTIPTIGWVAKLGAGRSKLASFSIAKYGAQTDRDWQWMPDAGNGIASSTGQRITGNDPNDANTPSNSVFQQQWANHLVNLWGTASGGGLRYYILDNEPSLWHETHRDVHPTGATMDEIRDKFFDYAAKIKDVDAAAQIVGPEEWGWSGYLYSGYDQQYTNSRSNWSYFPDQAAHGGWYYLPWLLDQLRQKEQSTGRRLLDVFSVHYYPQDGTFGNDVSSAAQLRRNRNTRSLWDATYVDETWINDKINLIPRLKNWVNTYYPNTKTAITEYNWGAESHINGATTQADVLGIFGREGLDMATRWTTPAASTPTYKAMKIYRNYDGQKSGFGDLSVACAVPNPDNLSAFAALRSGDGALTIMVVSKVLSGNTAVNLSLGNFASAMSAQVWQLTSSNNIARLNDAGITTSGGAPTLSATVPPQSITLFVISQSGTSPVPTPVPTPGPTPTPLPTPTATPTPTPTPTPVPTPVPTPQPAGPTFTSKATASRNPVQLGLTTSITAIVTDVTGTLSNGIVDLEIYNASGAQVAQQAWSAQSFSRGQKRSYVLKWNPSARGTYSVKVGVFHGSWSPMYHWNNNALTVTVK